MGTWEGLFVSVIISSVSEKVEFDVNENRSAFAAGLNNGGASGLLYGYLLAWSGTAVQVLIMAELGSMYVGSADV